jgi:hypothetical protein
MKQFYIKKIGQHLQELAILGLIFIPLDKGLTGKQLLLTLATCSVAVVIGIEMERRTGNE